MAARFTHVDYPWGRICHLIGALGSDCLEQAIRKFWNTRVIHSRVSLKRSIVLLCLSDSITSNTSSGTPFNSKRSGVRDLLAQSRSSLEGFTPRVMLSLAHNLNRQGRCNESEEIGHQVLSLVKENKARGRCVLEKIDSLKPISRSQHSQKTELAADKTTRRAIRMIVSEWGFNHSWALEFMLVLRGWLRGWAGEEDANVVRAEIDGLMGRTRLMEKYSVENE